MKKIVCIFLIFIFVFSLSINAFASDDDGSGEEWRNYYVKSLVSYSFKAGATSGRGYYYDVSFSINKKLCGYFKEGSTATIYLYLYDDAGNIYPLYDNLASVKSHCKYTVTPGGVFKYGDYYWNGSTFEFYSVITESENKLAAGFKWDTAKIEDSGFLDTNIPIFSDESSALKYINGEIGIDDALNSDNVIKNVYDSEQVPMPTNFRIVYEDYKYYVMWEYTPEDLKKLSSVKLEVVNDKFYTRLRNLKEFYENPVEYEIEFCKYYEPQLVNKIDVTKEINSLRDYIESKYYNMDLKFQAHFTLVGTYEVRDTDVLHSKKAHALMTIEKNDEGGLTTNNDSYTTDKDGNVLDSELFGPSFVITQDISSGNFVSNIVNAFGLLGSNGFVACCQATLSCFPSFIWDILGVGLQAGIIVFLLKQVLS